MFFYLLVFFIQEAISVSSTFPSTVNNLDPRLISSLQYAIASSSSSTPAPTSQPSVMTFPSTQFSQAAPLAKPLGQVGPPESSLQSSPAREEGEVPESELDPDTRRRLLILQHGQDVRDSTPSEAPFPVRTSMQVSVPRVQSRASWVTVEEEMSPRQLNRTVPREFPIDPEPMHIEKHRPHHPSFFSKVESSIPSERMLHENQRLPKVVRFWGLFDILNFTLIGKSYQPLMKLILLQAPYKDDRLRLNQTMSNYQSFLGEQLDATQYPVEPHMCPSATILKTGHYHFISITCIYVNVKGTTRPIRKFFLCLIHDL